MLKTTLTVISLLFIALSISCNSIMPAKTAEKPKGPVIDFTAPGKPLDVKVQLDKKQTASGKISASGGSVSLTTADGSKFTLNVPAGALTAETEITMTAVKSLDGAPLDKNTPLAVQLEPSGLFFREIATLTIVPAKEIPIKEQVVFGYEEDGKDYHLAPVDPKSKDIKIMLMGFSGVGVGSASDSAWAANLMIQAGSASTRILQKFGEYTQKEHQRQVLGDNSDPDNWREQVKSSLDQFEDQVVQKEMVAAELDCKHAQQALKDLIFVERMRRILDFEPTPSFHDKFEKLLKIGNGCKKAYRISGTIDDAVQKGVVCDSSVPFTVPGTLKFQFTPTSPSQGRYTYSGPFNASGSGPYEIHENGKMTVSGTGCIMGHCATYSHDWTATPIDPCGN